MSTLEPTSDLGRAPSPVDAIPDSECFLESSMITVIVQDTKFRLDSHFLQRESDTLKDIITASKGDSIRLKDATVNEFRALWRYFYEGMYDTYKPSNTEWTDLLSIANTYGLTKVYRRAVSEIDDLDAAINPVERILLAKLLKVDRWLAPAYVVLCSRTDPITASEAEKLGIYTFAALVAARESFYRETCASNTSMKDPVSLVTPNLRCCGYSPTQLTANASGGRNCPSCCQEVIRASASQAATNNNNRRCCNYQPCQWQTQPDGSQRCPSCQGIVVPAPIKIESPREKALAIVNRVFGLEDDVGKVAETPSDGKGGPVIEHTNKAKKKRGMK